MESLSLENLSRSLSFLSYSLSNRALYKQLPSTQFHSPSRKRALDKLESERKQERDSLEEKENGNDGVVDGRIHDGR